MCACVKTRNFYIGLVTAESCLHYVRTTPYRVRYVCYVANPSFHTYSPQSSVYNLQASSVFPGKNRNLFKVLFTSMREYHISNNGLGVTHGIKMELVLLKK